jgi:hypothetical protein
LISDVLKRSQESTDLSKIEGRFITAKAQHLEGHSFKYIFEKLTELEPSIIAADGDVKLQKLVAATPWRKPVTFALDLAHQIKNSRKKIENCVKKSNLTGNINGASNSYRRHLTDHFQKNLLFFSEKVPPKKRTVKTWEKITDLLFCHLRGEKFKNYKCPVFCCPHKDFFKNANYITRPSKDFQKKF